MIRKIIHIGFAFLLLITSAGFSISKHYCNDHLVEIVVDQEAKSCCGDADCCHTETILIQLNDEAIGKSVVAVPSSTFSALQQPVIITLMLSLLSQPDLVEFIEYISPPPPKIQTILSNIQSYLL